MRGLEAAAVFFDVQAVVGTQGSEVVGAGGLEAGLHGGVVDGFEAVLGRAGDDVGDTLPREGRKAIQLQERRLEGLGVLFVGVEVVGPHRADHEESAVAARQQRSQETQELLRRGTGRERIAHALASVATGGGGQQFFKLIDGQQQRRGGRLDGRAPGLDKSSVASTKSRAARSTSADLNWFRSSFQAGVERGAAERTRR